MELLAHVFTRPSELREAKWSEFDLQKAEWNIPAARMKMGLAHRVQGVRGVYLRADFKQERRLLMEWYSNWLLCDDNNQIQINELTEKL
ncbi:MAG: hypothetical protein LEGION0403_FIIPPAGN_01452 [Legionella sp.]